LSRALPARYVPSSGFGHPLDGFLPSIPRRLFFTPAALLGFTLRSFLLPEGRLCVSARARPPTVSSCKWNHLPRQEAGPAGRGFWAYPPESPWRPAVGLARRPLEAPLGLPLLGFALGDLDRDFTRPPLARFAAPRSPGMRWAPQSLDQSPPASARYPTCKRVRASGGTP
jgi:hypothetical protein